MSSPPTPSPNPAASSTPFGNFAAISLSLKKRNMEMMLHSVHWVEIPVADFERARKFYNAIYDFDMPTMPMGPGGKNQMGILLHDQSQNGVGAAIVWGEGYTPSPLGPKVYLFGGTDLNTILQRVPAAGGQILMPKMLLPPDMGHIAMFADTEGNHLLLYSKF